jgi:hypothetical protein
MQVVTSVHQTHVQHIQTTGYIAHYINHTPMYILRLTLFHVPWAVRPTSYQGESLRIILI